MDSGFAHPFRSGLGRDDFSALEQASRGLVLTPSVCQRLVNLGLITRALGGYMLTAKGSLMLASGPSV
jgi:hypothetical protein